MGDRHKYPKSGADIQLTCSTCPQTLFNPSARNLRNAHLCTLRGPFEVSSCESGVGGLFWFRGKIK